MLRAQVRKMLRAARIEATLSRYGLEITCERKEHYSNLRFDCYGRLQDGRVRRSYRLEAKGRTYPVRGLFKAAGWRWDGGAKVWHTPVKNYDPCELGARLCRAFAES